MSQNLTPLKAIKAHCLDCSGGFYPNQKECEIPHCPLYMYRLGTNPNRKLNLSDEQRKAIGERLHSRKGTKDG